MISNQPIMYEVKRAKAAWVEKDVLKWKNCKDNMKSSIYTKNSKK